MGGWDKSEPTPPSSAARRGGTIFRWLPPHRRRSPSYNLLVNFASLLEGYVRWDKKYPEWCPPAFLPHLPHPSGTVAAAFVLSPFFACTPAPAVLPAPARTSAPAAAAATAAATAVPTPTPSAIGLEYQGCLHRATGLHHCLRRSANHHQPPTSATLALSLHPPLPATRPRVFVLRQCHPSPSSLPPPRGQTPLRI